MGNKFSSNKSTAKTSPPKRSAKLTPQQMFEQFKVALAMREIADMEKLLASGFDINYQNEEGNTILHIACQNDIPVDSIVYKVESQEILFLIEKGARGNIENKNGAYPIHLYCEQKRMTIRDMDPTIITTLMSQLPDINARYEEMTVLNYLFVGQFINEPNDLGLDVKITKHREPHIANMLNNMLQFHPDLNILLPNGDHILERLSDDSPLREDLIKHGAKPVILPEMEKLDEEAKTLQDTTKDICETLRKNSSKTSKDLPDLIEEIKVTPEYTALEEKLTQVLNFADVKFETVTNSAELEALEAQYAATHYIFVNRPALARRHRDQVVLYPKINDDEIAKLYNTSNLRKLGWELLSRRLRLDLQEKISATDEKTTLNYHDFTTITSPLLLHATNSNPDSLKEMFAHNYLRDMPYFSCTLTNESASGFTQLQYADSAFPVFLILESDPTAIIQYNHKNISSPFARSGGGSNAASGMIYFALDSIKQAILENYVIDRLVKEGRLPKESDVLSQFAIKGLHQLQAETQSGSHNEIILLGDQLASSLGAKPTKIIGLAVDRASFNRAANQDSNLFKETVKVLNESGLHVVMLNFQNTMNPFYPLEKRISLTMSSYLKQQEDLKKAYAAAARSPHNEQLQQRLHKAEADYDVLKRNVELLIEESTAKPLPEKPLASVLAQHGFFEAPESRGQVNTETSPAESPENSPPHVK